MASPPTKPHFLSRRTFLKTTTTVATGIGLGVGLAADNNFQGTPTDLPMGTAPKPLSFSHFPDRLHAFVWRNWPLVPASRMARVVAARTADIARIGKTMGLGNPPHISRDQQARSYITIIKRNWHLLPYPQLLDLLGWTADKLRYTLREDDFLFVKLGNLKPQCAPLRYQAPTSEALQRQREIGRIVRDTFPPGAALSSDPLFGFIERLSQKPAAASPPESRQLKFCYSYFAQYGDPLLETNADPYPEQYLARLAQKGVNGVWLQAVLYKLAVFPWQPELSSDYQTRLKNLRGLVARAAHRGVKVFLYLNEPRAMPLPFFKQRPQLKGVVEGDHAALCTSDRAVQDYLVKSVASICHAVPGLGGLFSISASENLTNCWSHYTGNQCPRCGKRTAAEVIAEVNSLFSQGIAQAGSVAKLIAWDWGWKDEWAGDVIERLPAKAELMSVSEWRLPLDRGGLKTEVGEYSISAVGPGPRARRHWQLARERQIQTLAKVQAGNTWELSSVPWIPAGENVARHAENLRQAGVSGFMLGWTLGGYPSPNLELFSQVLAGGTAEDGMRTVAERRFGTALAPAIVTAWRQFSAAFREFPFHGGVLYSAPQQLGPANLLWAKPTGYAASMVGFPYDDLDAWRAVYPANIFIQQLDKVADGFTQAIEQLRNQTAGNPKIASPQRRALEEELRMAEVAAIHFRSAANQARFVTARGAVAAAKISTDAESPLAVLQTVLKDEISLARRLHAIQSADCRIGFEASNQYYYVPIDLAEKVLNCRHLLESWLPQLRSSKHA